jgi:hypothetical protein
VDVSVLVQDADSGELVPGVRVTVRAILRVAGAVGGSDQDGETLNAPATHTVTHVATAEAATNKLYRAAVFELPESGWWDMEVIVEGQRGSAHVRFAVEAADSPPRWWALVPWVGWPAVAVALFSVHQVLVRRRRAP